jgi:hypothetical protein
MKNQDNIQLARDMLKAHAAHESGWVDTYYHEDCQWTEMPINGVTDGRSGGLDALKSASDLAAKTFPSLVIEVTSIFGDEGKVAIELDFAGTTAPREGSGKAPRVSKLKMAILLTYKDGKIIRQVDYLVPTD